MSVPIGTAMSRGVRRTLSASGLAVFVLALTYQVLFASSTNTVFTEARPAAAGTVEGAPGLLVLPVSAQVATALAVVSLLAGFAVFLLGARLFARPTDALSSVPARVFTRRILPAFLTTVVVSLIIGVLVALGLALLIVPGVFLAVSLQFAIFAVAVEDTGPLAALSRSWELASGDRWQLLGLAIVVSIVSTTVSILGTVVTLVNPTVAQFVSLAANTVVLAFTYGVLADAYLQVRDGATGSGTQSTGVSDMEPL